MALNNAPNRAFSMYATTRPDVPWRTKLAHVTDAIRDSDIPHEEGRIIWNTDDGAPNISDGSDWYNSANAGGYTTT